MMQKLGVDRLAALFALIDAVRRGGTLSIICVYGGRQTDPMPMLTPVRQAAPGADGSGQREEVGRRHHAVAHRARNASPGRRAEFATHRLPLSEAPAAYVAVPGEEDRDGTIKVVFQP